MNDNATRKFRIQAFRYTIASFINERLEAKLKGLSGENQEQVTRKYDYNTWLEDAARRASQIQAVTHILKASHPDARGGSLYATPAQLPQHNEIGTHSLGTEHTDDIVGNAAALDVYKFLKLEVEGRRLLDWLQADDADLLTALNDDATIAVQWAAAFKELTRSPANLSSHNLAKQIYWNTSGEPCDDKAYHLLQPMFASSLAHAVHHEINDARFGEANKLARQARRDGKPHDAQYRDYRGLVVRKMGGTKPQNISQLNSERGGVNYLLASVPPAWHQHKPRSLLYIDSALERFSYFDGVREQLNALTHLLNNNPTQNGKTRSKREEIECALGQAFVAFGITTQQQFEPGWSRDPNCKLPECEQLWLDPGRAELPPRDSHQEQDLAFTAAYTFKDWPGQIAHRYGNWINAVLLSHNLPVGDVEHAHWAHQAFVDAQWPVPMRPRRMASLDSPQEVAHE